MPISTAKQIANAKNPRMTTSRSEKVLGTSSETTSSVTANAKTASVKPSRRDTSVPRHRKPSDRPTPEAARL